MKKILALLLVMMISISALTGCFIFEDESNAVTGKEGAMLALASERLHGNFTGGNSLFTNAEDDLRAMAEQGKSFAMMRARGGGTEKRISADEIVSADRNNTQFNETVMRSVDLANRGADYIKNMKEIVRVVDTWVEFDNQKMLLHVEENSELLLCESPEFNESFVCYRTRDEHGVERYELLIEARDSGYTMRAVYIKDELYEYTETFPNSITGSIDYIGFRAENVGGIWECMESRYHPDNTIRPFGFRYVIFTDELCFSADIAYYTGDLGSIFLSTSDRKTDIMMVTETDEGFSMFSLQIGAFSGYDGILYEKEHEGYLVLKNGKNIHSYSDINEKVAVQNLTVYETAWGTEAEMVIHVFGDTLTERRSTFKSLLINWGLECVESLDTVFLMLTEAREIANEIHKDATWHGERINDEVACERALDKENAKFAFLFAFLEEYKDYEVVQVNILGKNSPLVSFAKLEGVDANYSVASDGLSFTVTNAVATVKDLTLFTEGDRYYLAVGLKNAGGIVHLGNYDKTYTVNNGSSILLEIGENSFDVSKITPGEYEIVIYASTEDGIRSSAPATIGNIVIP